MRDTIGFKGVLDVYFADLRFWSVSVLEDLLFVLGTASEEEANAFAIDPLDPEDAFGGIHHSDAGDVYARSVRWCLVNGLDILG